MYKPQKHWPMTNDFKLWLTAAGNISDAHDSVLKQDIGALVCAYWNASGRLSQDQLNKRSNFFEVTRPSTLAKTDDGAVVNDREKPFNFCKTSLHLCHPWMVGFLIPAVEQVC